MNDLVAKTVYHELRCEPMMPPRKKNCRSTKLASSILESYRGVVIKSVSSR